MKIQQLFTNLNPIGWESISIVGALLGLAVIIVLLCRQKRRVDLSKYTKNVGLILKK